MMRTKPEGNRAFTQPSLAKVTEAPPLDKEARLTWRPALRWRGLMLRAMTRCKWGSRCG